MINFEQVKIVPYPPELIFEIVKDIEAYPAFIPWCDGAKIITKQDNKIIADLNISYSFFQESYRSEVISRFSEDIYYIEVLGISGPFKHLANSWKISAEKDGSKVEFSLALDLNTSFLQPMIESFFRHAGVKMITAFENRAKILSQLVA